MAPRHMAAKTRLRKAEQSVIVFHRSLSLSPKEVCEFFVKLGRRTKYDHASILCACLEPSENTKHKQRSQGVPGLGL